MEALGAVASSITLLEVSLKTLGFVRQISEVQEDFANLREEIITINTLIQDLQSLPVLFHRNPSSLKAAEPRSIFRAASQLRQIKDDLENIAAYCAANPNNGTASLARKRKWVLKQNRISKLLVKARDAKENVQVAVNLHLATLFALQSMTDSTSHSEGTSMILSPRGVQSLPTKGLHLRVDGYTVGNHQDAKLKPQEKISESIAVSGEPPNDLAPSPGLQVKTPDVPLNFNQHALRHANVGLFYTDIAIPGQPSYNYFSEQRVASQIHQALDWGHCQADEVNILSKVLSIIDDVPQYNTTLVHLATLGELEMMEALEEEPWAIDQPDRYGMAPIHYASMDGDLEILKMLIWAEADVNISDLDGLTPLMFAALNGDVDCVRLLVDSECNIEQRSHTEFRAIHYAAQFCQPRSVLALVAAGASASARGWLGQTPLHRLARCEMNTSFEAIKETISSLLVSKGVSIDARDSNGDTPVFRAIAKGNIPVLRCLVEAGASLLPVNDRSRNILHMVAMYPDDGILRYLLSLDSGVFFGINTEHRDADGRTSMDLVPIHDPGATQSPQRMTECGSVRQEIQKLDCLVRYANLRHRSEQLRTIIRLVDQKQASCARLQLAHVINEKKEWGQLEWASWYRGIGQMIQALDYDKVIIALEDDVQQLTAQIGTIAAAGMSNEGGVSEIFNWIQ
ncbi:unnamed protein product [Clonostachys rhizophaga]|uniref:Uncharacterized protein n=1 Tax=Clonostachys rhizophaga TaxID=160324 RepID=A0A9N9VW92_9HYPO|nr:unnamed protein product [Clonostachys rhizophaga]